MPVINVASAARLAGSLSEELLGRGVAAAKPVGQVGTAGINVNGALRVERFTGPAGDSIDAVIKDVKNSGPLDLFGARVAKAAGLGDSVPAMARRDSGATAIEFIPGETFWNSGVRSVDDLDALLTTNIAAANPAQPASWAAREARVRRETMQAVTNITNDADFQSTNALVDARNGAAMRIDFGHLDYYPPTGADRGATVRSDFMLGAGTTRDSAGVIRAELDPETVRRLQQLDLPAVTRAFSELRADLPSVRAEYLDDIKTRLHAITSTGRMETKTWDTYGLS